MSFGSLYNYELDYKSLKTNITAGSLGRTDKTITANGNAQISTAQSKFGGASGLFDGNLDWLQISDTSAFELGLNDYTIECWMRLTALSPYPFLFDFRSTTNAEFRPYAGFSTATGNPFVFILNGNVQITFTDYGTITNTWIHVAIVRSSGVVKVYFNGVQKGSSYTDTSYFPASALRIGNHIGTTNRSVAGNLDEFRVSDIARYTSAFTPPTGPFYNDANTLLLLHMDGTNGSTTFLDDVSSTRSYKTITRSGNTIISTTQSKFGGASAYFDGTGDYLTITTTPDLGSLDNDFTIEWWIYRNSTAEQCMFDWRDGSNTTKGVSVINTSKQLRWIIGGSERILSNNTVEANQWNHLALVRSSGITKMYINGVVQTQTYTDSSIYTLLSTFRIGANYIANFSINGYVDEYRISDIARYTANFTPSTSAFTNDANTLLLMHMDGTNGSTTFLDDVS